MVVWSDPAQIETIGTITWLGWCYRVKVISVVPSSVALGDPMSVAVEVRFFALYDDGTCEIKPEGYAQTKPVEIHLDSPDGPLLATGVVGANGIAYFQSQLGNPVIIPESAGVGAHQLYAVTEYPCYNDAVCAACIGADYGGCG